MPLLLCVAAVVGVAMGAGALAGGCAMSGAGSGDGQAGEPADATTAAALPDVATPAATSEGGTSAAGDGSAAATPSAPASPDTTPEAGASGATPPQTAPDGGVLIVFDGDSLTAGTGTPGTDYPSYTLEHLPRGIAMVNVAVPGQEWGDMLADVEREVDPLHTASARRNILVVWAGTNDLHRTHTARRVWRELREYCSARRENGWQVVVLTVLPKIPTESGCRFERQRRLLNHNIRERWTDIADALADVAHDKRVGDFAGLFGARYRTDRVHLNAAGNRVIAEVVAAAVRPLLTMED